MWGVESHPVRTHDTMCLVHVSGLDTMLLLV